MGTLNVAELSIEEFRALTEAEKNYSLLDIREPGEYNAGHIPNATLLQRREIEFRIADLVPVRETPIIIVGDRGARARLAATTMAFNGYKSVCLLRGGYPAWMETGQPAVTGTNVPSKRFGEEIHRKCGVPEIDPQELHLRMARSEAIRVLDARTPEEYGRFCIPEGVNVPGGDLVLWAGDLKKEPSGLIVVNCAGRTRGIIGTETLRLLGLENVRVLKNGTMGWLLSGLELEQRPNRATAGPSEMSRKFAEEQAGRIARSERVPSLPVPELRRLMDQRGRRTLYLIDVRSAREYAAGHIPGFQCVPGGQAIQRADDYIAVRQSTIVFACDLSARAVMAAYWYRAMGFNDVYFVRGGVEAWKESGLEIETGEPVKPVAGLERARGAARFISVQELATELSGRNSPFILDVGASREYGRGHIPGALWLSRGWLEEKFPAALSDLDRPVVITCPTGDHSTLAGATLREIGYRNVFVLKNGTAAWTQEGLALQIGLTRMLSEPNDVVLSASITGDREAMRRYLEWEVELGTKCEKS